MPSTTTGIHREVELTKRLPALFAHVERRKRSVSQILQRYLGEDANEFGFKKIHYSPRDAIEERDRQRQNQFPGEKTTIHCPLSYSKGVENVKETELLRKNTMHEVLDFHSWPPFFHEQEVMFHHDMRFIHAAQHYPPTKNRELTKSYSTTSNAFLSESVGEGGLQRIKEREGYGSKLVARPLSISQRHGLSEEYLYKLFVSTPQSHRTSVTKLRLLQQQECEETKKLKRKVEERRNKAANKKRCRLEGALERFLLTGFDRRGVIYEKNPKGLYAKLSTDVNDRVPLTTNSEISTFLSSLAVHSQRQKLHVNELTKLVNENCIYSTEVNPKQVKGFDDGDKSYVYYFEPQPLPWCSISDLIGDVVGRWGDMSREKRRSISNSLLAGIGIASRIKSLSGNNRSFEICIDGVGQSSIVFVCYLKFQDGAEHFILKDEEKNRRDLLVALILCLISESQREEAVAVELFPWYIFPIANCRATLRGKKQQFALLPSGTLLLAHFFMNFTSLYVDDESLRYTEMLQRSIIRDLHLTPDKIVSKGGRSLEAFFESLIEKNQKEKTEVPAEKIVQSRKRKASSTDEGEEVKKAKAPPQKKSRVEAPEKTSTVSLWNVDFSTRFEKTIARVAVEIQKIERSERWKQVPIGYLGVKGLMVQEAEEKGFLLNFEKTVPEKVVSRFYERLFQVGVHLCEYIKHKTISKKPFQGENLDVADSFPWRAVRREALELLTCTISHAHKILSPPKTSPLKFDDEEHWAPIRTGDDLQPPLSRISKGVSSPNTTRTWLRKHGNGVCMEDRVMRKVLSKHREMKFCDTIFLYCRYFIQVSDCPEVKKLYELVLQKDTANFTSQSCKEADENAKYTNHVKPLGWAKWLSRICALLRLYTIEEEKEKGEKE